MSTAAVTRLGYITGPWVGPVGGSTIPVLRVETLPCGLRVFMIEDDGFCKIVSESGECRYFRGLAHDFNAASWATYSAAERGVYVHFGGKTAVVIGAGNRGNVYARYALEHPNKLRIVGVAEPRPYARDAVRESHAIVPEMCFADWEALVRVGRRVADAVIITTQDAGHVEPATACAELGYAILLEKPMAPDAAGCRRIVEAVKRNGVLFSVGHVLRYTPLTQLQIKILRSGLLGEVLNVQHLEPIGWFHFAHSFVRGNWRREDESSCLLLAKCCHDVDLLRYIVGKRIRAVSSFGSLQHFRPDKRPAGAADRCMECPAVVEGSCPYSAKRIYLERASAGHFGWPVAPILDGPPSVASVEDALRRGPYGRCVWACDNDVVDHQVVNIEFEGGATASLTTVSGTEKVCQRYTRIFGSRGQLEVDAEADSVRHFDFDSGKTTVYKAAGPPPGTALVGHGGADYFLMNGFVEALLTGDPSHIVSGPSETLESHLVVFAADNARRRRAVVELGEDLATADLSW